MDFNSNSSSSDTVDYDTEIFEAITFNNVELIDLFIDNNLVNLNHRSPLFDGHTFLTKAVSLLRLEIVDLLLNWGANPNFPEAINGNTPLDIAFSVIPSLRPETEENLRLRHHIVQLLVNSGGRHKPQDVSSLSSGPSDPDYELMDNQAATVIQNMIRQRQNKQKTGSLRKNVGRRSADPNSNERSRMYHEHIKTLDPFDPYRQYAHIPFFSKPKVKKTTRKKKKKMGSKRR